MARRTTLEKNGDLVVVKTDGNGTQVIDGNGSIIVTYGGDRHDEVVEYYILDGWIEVTD